MKERSNKLKRQFKKILGDENIEQFIPEVLPHLRDLNFDSKESLLNTLENFSAFCDAVEESYTQYEEKNKMAVRNLEISSRELSEVNRSLEGLNSSINAMLESLGEGLLFFDEKGICSSVFSKACLDMLETNPSNMHIRDVLRLTGNERDTIDSWIAMLFNNDLALSFSDLAAIAPSQFRHSKGRAIHLEFKPMYRADQALSAVLIIATDRTKEEDAKRELKERESRALRTLRIAKNRNHFVRYVEQLGELFSQIQGNACYLFSIEQFKRDIHTLKGIAATFQFHDMAKLLNNMESEISHLIGRGVTDLQEIMRAMRHFMPDGYAFLSANKTLAAEVLGENFEQMGSIRTIETRRLIEFSHYLKTELERGTPASEIERSFFERIMAVPVHLALQPLEIQLHELAEKIGKRIGQCSFLGQNFLIYYEVYESLFASFIHVARNIIDHGIEEPGIRSQLGKPVGGVISVTTEKYEELGKEWMRIAIADDGNGIHIESLREKIALKPGCERFYNLPDPEMIQVIFEDDISTRDEVSALSGRGVGMSAVRSEAEHLGGKVWIETVYCKGTTLFIDVPILWNTVS